MCGESLPQCMLPHAPLQLVHNLHEERHVQRLQGGVTRRFKRGREIWNTHFVNFVRFDAEIAVLRVATWDPISQNIPFYLSISNVFLFLFNSQESISNTLI